MNVVDVFNMVSVANGSRRRWRHLDDRQRRGIRAMAARVAAGDRDPFTVALGGIREYRSHGTFRPFGGRPWGSGRRIVDTYLQVAAELVACWEHTGGEGRP